VNFWLTTQKKIFDHQSKKFELDENLNFLISKKNKIEEKNYEMGSSSFIISHKMEP
jgi:hypothetical protein